MYMHIQVSFIVWFYFVLIWRALCELLVEHRNIDLTLLNKLHVHKLQNKCYMCRQCTRGTYHTVIQSNPPGCYFNTVSHDWYNI